MNPWRMEIQDFASSCEKLLSPCMTSGEEPLNDEERQVILYYLAELRRLTTPGDTSPNCKKAIDAEGNSRLPVATD